MTALDWPGLMRAGLGALGLTPREFWGLTPAELKLMLGEPRAAPPLSRARLAELASAWPDRVAEERKEGDDGGDGRTGRI